MRTKRKEERTLGALAALNGRVFVLLKDDAAKERFVRDCRREGFSFSDGVFPSMTAGDGGRVPDRIMSVGPGENVGFTGTMGHLAFHHAEMIGTGKERQKLIRVDYLSYIGGERRFHIRKG